MRTFKNTLGRYAFIIGNEVSESECAVRKGFDGVLQELQPSSMTKIGLSRGDVNYIASFSTTR